MIKGASWNTIVTDISSPNTTTGSPDMSNIYYLYLRLYTNNATDTIPSGNIAMDFWHYADTSEFYIEIPTDSFTFDETNKKVTYQAPVTTTQYNYYNLNEFSSYNSDSTRKGGIRLTFTEVEKDDTTEIVFVVNVTIP